MMACVDVCDVLFEWVEAKTCLILEDLKNGLVLIH